MTVGVTILENDPELYGVIHPVYSTSLSPDDLRNSKGQQAMEAHITVEDHPIRYRVDGIAATSMEGHLMVPGEKITIKGHKSLLGLSMVDTESGASTVRITIFF